jgi:hypothetical protein
MTAALFLLIVGLLALHAALGAEAMLSRRRIAIAVACVVALPLTFGPIVPISHFIFEATSRPMLVVLQGVVALLLVAIAWRLAKRWKVDADAGFRVPCAGALISYIIWLGSSLWQSDYEQGPTPGVWDAPIYILDWLAAVAACLLLAIAAWRIPGSGLVFRTLIASYLVLVAILVYGTLG